MVASRDIRPRKIAGQEVQGLGFQTYPQDLLVLRDLARDARSFPSTYGGVRIAEIGSWVGESALAMIDGSLRRGIVTSTDIYCIDTWQGAPNNVTEVAADMAGGSLPLFALFAKNVGKYLTGRTPHRLIPMMMRSVDAAPLFEDSSLDMIFIDGDHSHHEVRKDIHAWLPKLRPGGTLCGHDYDEVGPVVDELLGRENIIQAGVCVWVYKNPN